MGSSPLTRGILKLTICYIVPHRFIPAHAGNTCVQSGAQRLAQFHPRSRGEYLLMIWIIGMMRGSSPLTRGIPQDGRLHFVVPEVHPRSRGEYYDDGVCDICNGGSSPLTRGIQQKKEKSEVAFRFIPAHAGNTG